jgi:O-acetyl-ADP-ribose deacetylase (regulator of RNase III)
VPATTIRSFETDTPFPRRGFSIAPWPSSDPTLELVLGDITQETTDAIVNPVGPGLVDLAIRRAAGPELLEAFHRRAGDLYEGKLPPRRALATPGFNLRAAHVIHCRPPVFDDDPAAARQDLVACHLESLRLARAEGWASVAFPAIGTGVYHYPPLEAAEAAVAAVVADLRRHGAPTRVRFVLATPEMLRVYAAAAAAANGDAAAPVERQ